MTTREAFEAFISAPPFEMPIERFDDRSAWPGSYTELEVDLAWQAWQAATDAAQAQFDKLQAQLVRQQASYEAEIKAEIDAALERAAEVCETILDELSFANAYECANECAEAIRALKESKE